MTGPEDDEDNKDDDCEKEPGVRGSVDRRSSGEEGWSGGEGKRRDMGQGEGGIWDREKEGKRA